MGLPTVEPNRLRDESPQNALGGATDQQPRRSVVGLRLALAFGVGLVGVLGAVGALWLSSISPMLSIPLVLLALAAPGAVAARLRPDPVGFGAAWLGEMTVPIVLAVFPDAGAVGDVGRLGYLVISLIVAAIGSVPLVVGFVVVAVLDRPSRLERLGKWLAQASGLWWR